MILYACVAAGTRTLFHHDPDILNPLSPLAVQCLLAAPSHHALYTHTVRNRIYAFLINQQQHNDNENDNDNDPLIFFAIAEEPLGRANLLLFLHRLRDTYHRQKPDEHFDISSKVEELMPLPPPPPVLTSSPPALKEAEELRGTNGCCSTTGVLDEKGVEMEIAVVDVRPVEGRQEVDRLWRQQVRVVVVFDVVICSVMFGIWLALCRGFQCISS